ncbi:MAG: hypothetical protein ACOYOB_06680 [Myxococcota bacterium]
MKIRSLAVAITSLVWLAGACGSPEQDQDIALPQDTSPDLGGDDATDDVADAVVDVVTDTVAPDVEPDVPAPVCPGGPGCTCELNLDCDYGLCLDTPQGWLCAQPCVGNCPVDFKCAQVSTGSGGDTESVCVPRFGWRCDPCSSSAQCAGPGHSDAKCIKRGLDGAFCGSSCAVDADCGDGFSCRTVDVVEGGAAKQCVLSDEAAQCPCSPRAAVKGLSTTCQISYPGQGDPAVCSGTRNCTAQGLLSDCSAPAPAIETCNALDDDCDGKTDEATCDDQNVCTLDACDPKGPGSGQDGCTHTPNPGLACDDGDVCTAGDLCKDGQCVAGPDVCDCTKNSDCAEFEDGDLCNGTLVCDTAVYPHKCKVDAPTVKSCDPSADTVCLKSQCAPATGLCSPKPASDLTLCTDGNACTKDDVCKTGQCIGSTLVCNDNNPCTNDSCDSGSGCIYANNSAACDDGNACTFGDACSGGQCKAGPPPACNDGKQNGNETDIDCGGTGTCSLPACGTCGSNATCKGNGDCASLSCKLGHCQAPSCVDGLKNGDEEGVDCGGSCNMCPSLFLLAGGANSFGARLMKGGTWEKTDLGVPTVDGVGLALLSAGGSGTVVGAIRYTKLQDPLDNTLQVTMYADHVWSQPKILAAGITTLSAPELVALTGKVQVAFHGLDHWYYFSEFNGNVWSPVETIGSPVQYGPVGPALASKSGVTTLAFLDGASSNDLKVIDRSASWGAAKYVGNGLNFSLSPAAVVPTSGPDLMLAAVKPDQQIVHSQRTSGTWTSAPLSSAWTTHRVAMAADNGQVALAFRGQDGKVYVTVWASVSGQWTVPATVGSTPATTKTTPAIAKGISSGWELAWVATDGTVFHSSQIGGVWSQAVAVGVNASSVTLTR